MDKALYFLFSVVSMIILIGILILIFSFVFLSVPNYKVRSFNSIADNWNRTLILDITLAKDKCPYLYEALILGYTESIKEMTDCSNQREYDMSGQETFSDIYNPQERQSYCVNKGPYPSLPIFSWRNSLICVRKAFYLNYPYMWSYIVSPYQYCKPGYKKCNGPVDTVNNYLCVRHEWECGINDIQIIDKNATYNSSMYHKLEFFDNEKSLIFARNVKGKTAIADFKVLKGKACANPAERSNVNYPYMLFDSSDYMNDCNTSIAGTKENPYFTLLDSTFALYSYVYDYSSSVPLLPKQNPILDYNLYSSPLIGGQMFCVTNTSTYQQFLIDYSKEYNFNNGAVALIVMVFILVAMGLLILFCVIIRSEGCIIFGVVLETVNAITIFIIAWIYYCAYANVAFYRYLHDSFIQENMPCFDNFHRSLITYEVKATEYFLGFFVCVGIMTTFLFVMPMLYPIGLIIADECYRWRI